MTQPNDDFRDASQGFSPEFAQQLTGCQSALYARIAALMGRIEGVQDVLQNTNLALCRRADEYDPARPFLAWAFTFARYEVMAWRKSQQRDRVMLDEALVNQLAETMAADTTATEHRLAALERCLESLPQDHRQLVAQRYQQGQSVQTIATKLSKTDTSVAAALYRIRKSLWSCVQFQLARDDV